MQNTNKRRSEKQPKENRSITYNIMTIIFVADMTPATVLKPKDCGIFSPLCREKNQLSAWNEVTNNTIFQEKGQKGNAFRITEREFLPSSFRRKLKRIYFRQKKNKQTKTVPNVQFEMQKMLVYKESGKCITKPKIFVA